jgi:hypothetical protein
LLKTLATISDSSLTTTNAAFTVSLSETPVLAADTRYWIGLSAAEFSSALWAFADDDSGTGVAGEFFSNLHGTQSNDIAPTEPYIMAVTGTPVLGRVPVPEPSTWALMALGFAGLGLAGYWRRRSVSVPA